VTFRLAVWPIATEPNDTLEVDAISCPALIPDKFEAKVPEHPQKPMLATNAKIRATARWADTGSCTPRSRGKKTKVIMKDFLWLPVVTCVQSIST
jgi:hypothetical protein